MQKNNSGKDKRYVEFYDNSLSAIKLYINQIKNVELLSLEEEFELSKTIQDSKDYEAKEMARSQMIQSNLKLVISQAKEFQNSGLPLMDLIQEGNIGLIKSIDLFEHERGHKFSTYAIPWIRQYIMRALSDKSRTIRIPVYISREVRELNKQEDFHIREYGKTPTDNELAEILDIEVSKVSELRQVARRTISIQSFFNSDNSLTLEDVLEDHNASEPYKVVALDILKESLGIALLSLTEQKRIILEKRFGLNGEKLHTLDDISEQFHLTRERIRQLESEALENLRNPKIKNYIDW